MTESGKILIVEDEDPIRLSLRDFLLKKGHDVVVASDGVGAIKQLLDTDVDVIVTDYRMSLLGGTYWVKFLQRFCQDKKVIITSGFLNPEYTIPFPVLYKPFEYARLESMIQDLLTGMKKKDEKR
jgi:DNA-binding NtrC family response regulator